MNSIESREGVVQIHPNEDKIRGLSNNWAQNTLAGGLPVSGNNPFWMGSPWCRYPTERNLPSASFLPPWPLISSPLTWAWHQYPRYQTEGMRSVPPLNRLLRWASPSSMSATSSLNQIFPSQQNLPYIVFPVGTIQTIPSLPLTPLLTSIPS